METWIDKYPRVKALLQHPNEVLEYEDREETHLPDAVQLPAWEPTTVVSYQTFEIPDPPLTETDDAYRLRILAVWSAAWRREAPMTTLQFRERNAVVWDLNQRSGSNLDRIGDACGIPRAHLCDE